MKLLFLLLFTCFSSFASIFKGTVYNEKKEILPFASLLIQNSGFGTMANAEGKFEINLPKGSYTLMVQYLGYETQIKNIEISAETQELNIYLKEIGVQLKELIVKNDDKNPAKSIIEQTIAMSYMHYFEIQSFKLKNYVRGSFKILDVPFFLEKKMKENFITKGQVYVMESLSEISFKQPKTFIEKKLSFRSNIPPNLKDAMISFEYFNLYDPSSTKSPITAKGASKYRYEYLGYFEDSGEIIDRIKVIPKINGQGLFDGIINIIDQKWYVHSCEFEQNMEFETLKNKVLYAPIQSIWVPVQIVSNANLGMLGLKANANVVSSYKNYEIIINPKYSNLKIKKNINNSVLPIEKEEKTTENLAALQKELSIKELKKLAKKYQSEKTPLNVEKVDQSYLMIKDSLWRNKSDAFWIENRQVPLTKIELEGYKKADSLYKIDSIKILKKIVKDSVNLIGQNKFKLKHLALGKTYNYSKSSKIGFKDKLNIGQWADQTRFDAVEGLNLGLPKISYIHSYDSSKSVSVYTKAFFATGRPQLNGIFGGFYNSPKFGIDFEMGRQIMQINNSQSISEVVSSFYALFGNLNYTKYFENKYVKIELSPKVSSKLFLNFEASFNQRMHLNNVISQGIIKNNVLYESNDPVNVEKLTTSFQTNYLTKLNFNVTFQPKNVVIYNNGIKSIQKRGDTYNLKSSFGLGAFSLGEISTTNSLKLGLGSFSYKAIMGKFFGDKPQYFIDYKHFEGNQTFFAKDFIYRNLPYFLYSTGKDYAQLFVTYEMPKLLLTQSTFLQKKGISEHLFSNYLVTPQVKYVEAGYGISAFSGKVKIEVFVSKIDKNANIQKGFRIVLPASF